IEIELHGISRHAQVENFYRFFFAGGAPLLLLQGIWYLRVAIVKADVRKVFARVLPNFLVQNNVILHIGRCNRYVPRIAEVLRRRLLTRGRGEDEKQAESY